MTLGIDPLASLQDFIEACGFRRGVTDILQYLLVRPHVVRQRRNIEVTDENSLRRRFRQLARPDCHVVEKLQLMGKLGIELGIGNRHAGGNVERVNLDIALDGRNPVAPVGPTAPIETTGGNKR